MKYFSKIATVLVFALGLGACGERPPIPAGDGSSQVDDETSVEAVIPACRTTDTVTGSWSYTFWAANGVDTYQKGTGTMNLFCASNPNDTGVSLIWGNPNTRANYTAYYAGSPDWTQDWMGFDFIAPDGNEYLTQSWGLSACRHSGGPNRWHCPMYVRFPSGALATVNGYFTRQ